MTIKKKKKCPDCKGDGVSELSEGDDCGEFQFECKRCNGTGEITEEIN